MHWPTFGLEGPRIGPKIITNFHHHSTFHPTRGTRTLERDHGDADDGLPHEWMTSLFLLYSYEVT